jgi:hypothetical protein
LRALPPKLETDGVNVIEPMAKSLAAFAPVCQASQLARTWSARIEAAD